MNNEELKKKNGSDEKEPFLVKLIRYSVFAALLSPLVVSTKYYFPFVGPKALFFMAFAEIIFFAWALLITKYKRYRTKKSWILAIFFIFLIVMTLSTVMGADFSRSFWSKFERMTGLLMWLHVFGFFLAVSSTFKKVSDWKKFFWFS